MPQYSVPQFIEVEDKIIGPFSLKQFLVLLGGAGIVFFLYKIISNLFFAILAGLPIAAATLFFVFGQFNGRSIGYLFSSALGFMSEPRYFVFHKKGERGVIKKEKEEEFAAPQILAPEEKLSRLHKLTYILDQDVKAEEELLKK